MSISIEITISQNKNPQMHSHTTALKYVIHSLSQKWQNMLHTKYSSHDG